MEVSFHWNIIYPTKKIKIKRRERKKERKERKGKLENPGHFMKETFCYEALMIQWTEFTELSGPPEQEGWGGDGGASVSKSPLNMFLWKY